MEERHYLVGTAGHVDHGKSELIRALTGIETDRLKEEKQRGISIELGFAHMTLPSGRKVGIVDVPGHERFVRQMLAGATGMDLVLLVIAADEGVMPQTREHLDILSLLGIARGIVVITKIDLVDQEWLELVREEIKEELKGTPFAQAPVCPVSAYTGDGLDRLRKLIDSLLNNADSKKASGPVRLPIDRVFSVQGFGTVVTGTLHNGTVQLGQELAVEPGHLFSKVRSLQVHGEKVESAKAGQRVAVNLAGVDVAEVEKGSVLITPGAFKVGKIIDLKILNLPTMDKPITHRQRVRFHIGTVEVLGRIHLLEHEELQPGQEGYAQILLEESVVAAPNDRFVIRFYSPAHTIAGGKILGVTEYKRKRFNENSLAQLRLLDQGDPLELLEKELKEPLSLKELTAGLHLSEHELEPLLDELHRSGRLEIWHEDGEALYWAIEAAKSWRQKLIMLVKNYQKSFPLRGGLGREELKTKLGVKWAHRRWQNLLEEGGVRGFYKLVGSKVQSVEDIPLPQDIAKKLECLRKRWQDASLMPPDLESAAVECGIAKGDAPEYAAYLCEQGEWHNIGGMYFTNSALKKAQESLITFLQSQGEVSVGEVRELWGTSRKYAVPLLEYFDQQHITRRQGDKRMLY